MTVTTKPCKVEGDLAHPPCKAAGQIICYILSVPSSFTLYLFTEMLMILYCIYACDVYKAFLGSLNLIGFCSVYDGCLYVYRSV